ncbi:MAG: PilZ domain-containing protein [Thermodesulfobacteriota bacterium]
MPERRRWERFILRLAGRPGRPRCSADVAGMALACEVADLSCGGMRLAVSDPEARMGLLHEGQRVELAAFEEERLAFLAGKRGIVSWIRPAEREFGVCFDAVESKTRIQELALPSR